VSPKYNIFNFTESYRNAEHKHTILLPVVMVLVVLGCYWLVTKTRPTARKIVDGNAKVEVVAKTEAAITAPPKINIDFDTALPPPPLMDSPSFEPKTGGVDITVPVAKLIQPPLVSKEGLPLVESKQVEKFTDWMTPTELNDYILALNQGQQVSFWERGYWIVAVEGRWAGNRQEYRIVYDKTPPNSDFQWRYRIAQSGDTFRQNLQELGREGFTLVQSQFFELPNRMCQYQAVWQKLKP